MHCSPCNPYQGGPGEAQTPTRVCVSPLANHPALLPQCPPPPKTLDACEVLYAQTLSPPPPGLPGPLRVPAPAAGFVHRSDSVGGPHAAQRVAFSWDSKGNGSQWDENQLGRPSRDSEDVIMKRIIETREELGRLKRENAMHDAAARGGAAGPGGDTAHSPDARALWAECDGRLGAYSWAQQAPERDDDEELWTRYNADERMTGRWPTRDQALLAELEFTNLKLQRERKRKERRGSLLLRDAPDDLSLAHETGRPNPRAEAESAGWDLYVPLEKTEYVIPCGFLCDLGAPFDYNAMLSRSQGAVLERRFMAAAEASLSELFRQPLQHTIVRYVEVIEPSVIRLHAEFEVGRKEVATVAESLNRTLRAARPTNLKHASQVLKEAKTPAVVELQPLRSWVGYCCVAQVIEGYGAPAPAQATASSGVITLTLVDGGRDFDASQFRDRLAREMGVRPQVIEVLEERSGTVDLRVVGTYDADAVARQIASRFSTPGDPIHTSVCGVSQARYQPTAAAASALSDGGSSRRRRRRRRDGSESGRSSGSGRRSRRRRSSSPDRDGSRRGSSGRRRRRDESGSSTAGSDATGSPSRSRRRRRSSSPEGSRSRRSSSDGSPERSRRRRSSSRSRRDGSPERSRRRRSSSDGSRRRRRRDEGSDADSPSRRRRSSSRRRRSSNDGSPERSRRRRSEGSPERSRSRRRRSGEASPERSRRSSSRRRRRSDGSPERSRRRRSSDGGSRRRRRRDEASSGASEAGAESPSRSGRSRRGSSRRRRSSSRSDGEGGSSRSRRSERSRSRRRRRSDDDAQANPVETSPVKIMAPGYGQCDM